LPMQVIECIRVLTPPNDDIGHPKLFMSCQRASGKLAQQVVNNFAANRAATLSDWPLGFISGIGLLWFSRTGGPGLLTTSRSNDFQFYWPARRAGLDPLTTTQEGVSVLHDDFSILPSPGQADCGRPPHKNQTS
jgi:hypothetical protein